MTENFLNLKKETYIKVQEPQRIPNKMYPRRPPSTHTIIKMAKVRENSKGNKRKKQRYNGTPTRL